MENESLCAIEDLFDGEILWNAGSIVYSPLREDRSLILQVCRAHHAMAKMLFSPEGLPKPPLGGGSLYHLRNDESDSR
jgi:hypothetical protein